MGPAAVETEQTSWKLLSINLDLPFPQVTVTGEMCLSIYAREVDILEILASLKLYLPSFIKRSKIGPS